MTLNRIALSNYDPVNPDGSEPLLAQTCSTFGAVLPVNTTRSVFDTVDSKDPLVRQSLRYLILAGLGLTFRPKPQDILLTGEGPYRILGLTPFDPSGEGAIIFEVGASLDVSINLDGAVDDSDPDIILDGGNGNTNDTLTTDGGD